MNAWLKKHAWLVAALLVIIGGYSVGKDMAMRDNARDAQTHVGGDT